MPHFEIKHRETGAVIYSGDASTLRALVERAVSEGADLRRAYLTDAYLSDAKRLVMTPIVNVFISEFN